MGKKIQQLSLSVYLGSKPFLCRPEGGPQQEPRRRGAVELFRWRLPEGWGERVRRVSWLARSSWVSGSSRPPIGQSTLPHAASSGGIFFSPNCYFVFFLGGGKFELVGGRWEYYANDSYVWKEKREYSDDQCWFSIHWTVKGKLVSRRTISK